MSNFWLFQANPDRFDMDGFFRKSPTSALWLTKRYIDDISIGDSVFLWRSIGNEKRDPKKAGLVALATVIAKPKKQIDTSDAKDFWTSSADANNRDVFRTEIGKIKIRSRNVDYYTLKNNSLLKNCSIFTYPRGTNFKITSDEAKIFESYF